MIVLALAITVYAEGISFAQTGKVTLAWDHYSDNADGIRIYASKRSPVEVKPENLVGFTVGTETNQIYITGLPFSNVYFVATAYRRDSTVPGNVVESEPSNEVMAELKHDAVVTLQAGPSAVLLEMK